MTIGFGLSLLSNCVLKFSTFINNGTYIYFFDLIFLSSNYLFGFFNLFRKLFWNFKRLIFEHKFKKLVAAELWVCRELKKIWLNQWRVNMFDCPEYFFNKNIRQTIFLEPKFTFRCSVRHEILKISTWRFDLACQVALWRFLMFSNLA